MRGKFRKRVIAIHQVRWISAFPLEMMTGQNDRCRNDEAKAQRCTLPRNGECEKQYEIQTPVPMFTQLAQA